MSRFFPCLGLIPDFSEVAVSTKQFVLHRRLWETSSFDMATLGGRHKLGLPWQLIDVFLSKYMHANCEIEVVDSVDRKNDGEKIRLLQSMLYMRAITPFGIPFGATHSVNQYAGINSRDSIFAKDTLPEGMREGITSDNAKIEIWQHEPSFSWIRIPKFAKIDALSFTRAVADVEIWKHQEANTPQLKVARLALQTAPMITSYPASLLHVWQGIEAIFPNVQTEVTFRISMLIAQLAAGLEPAAQTYKQVKAAYAIRSKAAHGNLRGIEYDQWIEAWLLLSLCMRAVISRNGLPKEDDLLAELFGHQ